MKAQKKPGTRQLNCDYPVDVCNEFIEFAEPNSTVVITNFMQGYVEEAKQEANLTPDQLLEKYSLNITKIKKILEGNVSEEALLKFDQGLAYAREGVSTKFSLLQEEKPKTPTTEHVERNPVAVKAYEEFLQVKERIPKKEWERCANCIWESAEFGSRCIKCGFKIDNNGAEIHEHHFNSMTGRCTCQMRESDIIPQLEKEIVQN